LDEFDFIVAVVNDASKEIIEKQEAKQEQMYSQIEITLQGVQQALQSSQAISTMPLPEGIAEEGDESVQLHKIVDIVEVRLRRAQEEKAQATQALKKAQEEIIEQRQAAQQEKNSLQAKFEEDRAKVQKEKEQLLAKQIEIEEAVNRAFLSVTNLEKKVEEPIEHQVMKLAEFIQQLQQRVMELELQTIPQTPQEVRDQRELDAQSAIERIRKLVAEWKQLSNKSVQIYEQLSEDPELKKLESQLQEVKQHADTVQAQLKLLSPIERMKRSQEQ
jgi:hypothetical protein